MKTKLVVFGIILLVMVITYGSENMLIGKVTSAYAKNTSSDKPGLSICKTTQVPKSSSLNETFTVTEGFKGNPAKFNGKCIVDSTSYSNSNPCTITKGIATAGHCETVTMGPAVTGDGPANLPTENWFHLTGVTLKPSQFLDLADTSPFFTTKGHSATVLPCDSSGQPLVRFYAGIIDGGINTLESPTPQYLQQLSSPQDGLCVYHFDIGPTSNNPDGVTDFAIINISHKPITFTDTNTVTLSVAEGSVNKGG